MNRASSIVTEATRLCIDESDYTPGPNGAPSRYARTLMDLSRRANAETLQVLSPDQYLGLISNNVNPEVIVRSVVQFGDGSVAVIFDGSVEMDESADNLIRNHGGPIVGAFGGFDVDKFMFHLASKSSDSFDDPDEWEGASLSSATSGEDEVTFKPYIPMGAESDPAVIQHVMTQTQLMSSRLGIPADELMEEVRAGIDAVARFRKSYSSYVPSPEKSPMFE